MVGVRDVLLPGAPLPFPGDDKYQLVFGSQIIKKARVPAPVAFPLTLVLGWGGVFHAAYAVIKLVTVFSSPEGTFLRRNLFATFGITELLVAANLLQYVDLVTNDIGVSPMPFVVIFTASGLVFMADALLRERKPKRK